MRRSNIYPPKNTLRYKIVQHHQSSQKRTLDENKLLRETQARGYPTIAQTDYPYRNSKAGKSKRKEDIVNRGYQGHTRRHSIC